jgi:hypothetical protein
VFGTTVRTHEGAGLTEKEPLPNEVDALNEANANKKRKQNSGV